MHRVMLSIKGSQNGDDNIELITKGELYKAEDSLVLKYNETEISGMEGARNTITVKEDTISLERDGSISTSLYFEEGKKFIGNYSTMLGDLNMSIYPTVVRHEEFDNTGTIDLEYELDLEGEQSFNTLNLMYKMIEQNVQ